MARRGENRDALGWTDVLSEIRQNTVKSPPGEGWKTMKEIIAENGMGADQTRALIKTGLENGTFESFDGTQRRADGRCVRAVWYRVVQG